MASPSLESVLITRSLPLWLLVSSEYPSSNRLEIIEEAGRKAWIYGGGANWAVLLLTGAAMMPKDQGVKRGPVYGARCSAP
jgi:hypothetical protein